MILLNKKNRGEFKMKFSKSILIFLFFLSFSVTFSYAMRKTKENIFKSFLFALFVLAIKMGLIAPNIPFELNQDQPNQQLISSVNKVESPRHSFR